MKWLSHTWGPGRNLHSHQTIYSRAEWDEYLATPLEAPDVRFAVPCDPGEPARRFAALFHRHVLASTAHVAYEDGYLVFSFTYFDGYTWEGMKAIWVRLIERTATRVLLCHTMGSGRGDEEGFDEPPDRSRIERIGVVPLFADDLDSVQLDLMDEVEVQITDEPEVNL